MGSSRASFTKLPPTERLHPRADGLDLLSLGSVVRRLHDEDVVAVRAVRPALPAVARAATAVVAALRAGGRLLYIGAGTSGRLGVLDASECPPTFGSAPTQVQARIAGGRRAMTHAVEGAEDDVEAGVRDVADFAASPRDVVCGISASASTPYVRGALREAKRRGAHTVLVCCNPPGTRADVDTLVLARTGPELVAGSTRLKAGTATKLLLNAITTAAFVALGRVYRGRMVGMRPVNAKLRARAARMVAELTGLPGEDAEALLAKARGEVRVAVAMAFTGLGAREARKRLEENGLRALGRSGRKGEHASAARLPAPRKRRVGTGP